MLLGGEELSNVRGYSDSTHIVRVLNKRNRGTTRVDIINPGLELNQGALPCFLSGTWAENEPEVLCSVLDFKFRPVGYVFS